MNIAAPSRPILRYHGGKWKLAPWVIGFFPPHRIYVEAFTERLKGVVIENRHAFEVISQHDGEDTLHYVDPPYPWSTRTSAAAKGHYYRHELADEDHISLAGVLHQVRGMVVISGYPCDLYDKELYSDWHRHERKHFADGARERTEVVWINETAHQRMSAQNLQLFERMAS